MTRLKTYTYYNRLLLTLLFVLLTIFTLFNKHYFLSSIMVGTFISINFVRRKHLDHLLQGLLFLSFIIVLLITVVIISVLSVEAWYFFHKVSIIEFLFGTQWQPYSVLIHDKVVELFGILPLLTGTLLITIIAISIAAPLGIIVAIYIAEYTSQRVYSCIKSTFEILAGIPTIVYGYFTIMTIAPTIRDLGKVIHLDIALESALSTGIAMGVMLVPIVIVLCSDIIKNFPKTLYYGAIALGSTRYEAITKVVLPVVASGIISAVLLAISRSIGETMIVLMATGVAAHLTLNPFTSVTTITVQIATLLTGDQTFNNLNTLSAYALALILFVVTWILNAMALTIVNKYRKKLL